MDLASLRPVISGIVGGLLAAWFLRKVARWVPDTCHGRPIRDIAQAHRWKLRSANAVGFACLIAGVALYQYGVFASNDWRGLGLAFGGACLLPSLVLAGASLRGGRTAVREAFVAYAVGQHTPPALLNGLLIAGTAVFFVTLGSLFGD